MEILRVRSQSVDVSLALDELLILKSALNEIANGVHIPDWEFQTRTGTTRMEARRVLAAIGDAVGLIEATH